ncbi:26089_t:CDS:10, partial [Racocetra persica]
MPTKKSSSQNIDPETNEADNLQSKQNQINESPNRYESNESSLFATDKYQHKVLSHMNTRPTSLRIHSIELVDPLVEQSNIYNKCSSNQKDESSEDEIFSSLGQYYNSNFSEKSPHPLNIPNMKYTNSYLAVQPRFIAGAVWEKPFKKHIDILDYNVFIKQQLGVKALVTLVAIRIHVEYLIAESKGENLYYTSMVLNHVKELDNIIIDIIFLAATDYDTQVEDNQPSYNNDQNYSNQHIVNDNMHDTDNVKFDQVCEEGDINNIYNENELYDNINIFSSNDEYELMDDMQKTFDRMKSVANWNRNCPFSPFENFTNMAIFTWVTQYMIHVFNCEDFVKYRSMNETIEEQYLVEESNPFIIDPSLLICRLNVGLQDQPALSIFEFFVSKILYYYNGRWKLRSIKFCHQHPSERISIKPPANFNIPILKFYLDLYYDDFGTFRNTYHSLGLVPFGGNFKNFIKPFVEEVHQLEQGFVMNVNSIDCWISGGLAIVTADLSQGNDIAGVLHHNANFECRSCKVFKNELTNITFDIYSNGWYHQITNQEFEIISKQQTNSARLQTCSQYGLQPSPGPLDSVLHDARLKLSRQNDVVNYLIRAWVLSAKLLDKELNTLIELSKSSEPPCKSTSGRSRTPICHLYQHGSWYKGNTDGGIDDRINNMALHSIFRELIIDPYLHHLLSGWCIDNNFSIHSLQEFDQEFDQNNDIDTSSFTHLNCSEIKLRSRLDKCKIE